MRWTQRKRTVAAALAAMLVAMASGRAAASGLLVPENKQIPPLAVKYLRVDARIDTQVATTHVVQEFQNSTDGDLECTFIFPLPKGAAVQRFAMYIGGKRVEGELLEKEKAARIYEEIVRRLKDPGLLEYMGGQLLKMRVYPVPRRGTQKVEVEYTQLLPRDGGLAEYVYPLRTGDRASRTLEDFTVAVRIRSDTPIRSVYSPTHEVGISRMSEHEAVAGVETRAALLDRDFQLFYTVSEKAFGLDLMTYRPDPAQPGQVLMLISPEHETDPAKRLPRDVVFALDTSGSMKEAQGEKLRQAKAALTACVEQLGPTDRFAIVQFATIARTFAEKDVWTRATDKEKARAVAWVEAFDANGGTNVSEALQRVFALPVEEDRPTTVLFLTDGRPTVDLTDIEALSQFVEEHNARSLRVFTFGVGDDVNTHLLDRMSDETGGLPEYVRPGEAIDGKVTRLFTKMSHPVLTDLEIEVPGVKLVEVYPRALPDLFHGSQIVLVGAYEGSGDSVIRLTGRRGPKRETFTYEGRFPKRTTERPFIAPLFAHRKIGYLLDQIRLHGESAELKEEVIRLSLAYGIETPYTSYLVLESKEQYAQYGIERRRANVAAPNEAPAGPPEAEGARRAQAADRLEETFAMEPADAPAAPTSARLGAGGAARPKTTADDVAGLDADEEALREADTGADAVTIATELQRLRQAENYQRDMVGTQTVQQRGDRRMTNYRGVWVDERFQGTEQLTKVKWGSEAYFALARERPELQTMLSLGQRVVVVTARNQALVVDDRDGAETMAAEAREALFEDQ